MAGAAITMAWRKSLNSLLPENIGILQPQKLGLGEVRLLLHDALRQCAGPACQRMRWRIDGARSAHDLWLLRGELFQLVAREFCQEEAVQRVNALLPAFSGWLPQRTLTRL